jgi:two-component system sensor histidine kinase BaeS
MPQLLDADNRVVIGAAQGIEDFRLLAIQLNGDTVGWLAMPQRKKITDGFELRFLEQQMEAFIVIGLAVIALAMLMAYLLSRHLLKPITSLTRATEQLTQGDFSLRLATDRQDELGLLVRDFNDLAESLQRSDASRKRWFADVSHELRTPLAILYAQIEAMLDGVRPLDNKGIVSIQQEVIHLNTLVNDLYTLSSADLGSLQYHKQRIDLSALLQEQVRLHHGPMQEAGLQLSLQVPQAACELQADPTRLCQLLDNLLTNSRKYTDAGGEVRITVSQQGRVVTLVVEDSSPGVPEESLGSLFDHLYRVEASRNRSTGGSGLGLAICQRIVEAHSGDIGVVTSSLGGLAVTIHLPQT